MWRATGAPDQCIQWRGPREPPLALTAAGNPLPPGRRHRTAALLYSVP